MPKAHNFEELYKLKFGRIKIVKDLGVVKKNRRVLVICDCGGAKETNLHTILNGECKSCGCLNRELSSQRIKARPEKRNKELSAQKHLFNQYKWGAIDRSRKFEITLDDFIQITTSNCFYCGIEPLQIKKCYGYSGEYKYNGIDRLNNNLGYELTNCVPCCRMCNIAKNNNDIEDFKNWINRVYNYQKKREK